MRGGGSTKHRFFLALQIAPFRLGDAVKLALITTPVSHREKVHLAQTQRTHWWFIFIFRDGLPCSGQALRLVRHKIEKTSFLGGPRHLSPHRGYSKWVFFLKIVISFTFYMIGRMDSSAWLGYSATQLRSDTRLGCSAAWINCWATLLRLAGLGYSDWIPSWDTWLGSYSTTLLDLAWLNGSEHQDALLTIHLLRIIDRHMVSFAQVR